MHEERGVALHAVVGAHREPDDVPGPHQALPGLGLGPALLLAQVLHQPGELRRGGDVADEHAAGHERLRDGVELLPRRQHVQHHPVDGLGDAVVGMDVGDAQGPVRRRLAEEAARRCAPRARRGRRAPRRRARCPRVRRRAAASR